MNNTAILKKFDAISFSYNSPFIFPEVIILEKKKLTFTNHENFIEEWFTTSRPTTKEAEEIKPKSGLKIKQTETITPPSYELNKVDISKSIVSLLNSDYEEIICDAQKMLLNITNDENTAISLECFYKFEKILKPILKYVYYKPEKIFIYELVNILSEKFLDNSLETINSDTVLTVFGYIKYQAKIINSLTPIIKELFPNSFNNIISEIEKFLLKKIANNPPSYEAPLSEIKTSIATLKILLTSENNKNNSDIYLKMFDSVHKLTYPLIRESFDDFLPELLKGNTKYKNQPTKKFHINRFSHLVFVVMYGVITEHIIIRRCPACNRFFVSSRRNRIYCDGIIPDSGKPCAGAGPQYVRNKNMPIYKSEYENAKKRLDSQLTRDNYNSEKRKIQKDKLKTFYKKLEKTHLEKIRKLRITSIDENSFTEKQKQLENELIEKVKKKAQMLAFDFN